MFKHIYNMLASVHSSLWRGRGRLIILILMPALAYSQDNVGIDSLGQKRLGVMIDAMAFFRDNEYESEMTKGYSLPGAWVRPTLQYNPNSSIHLELGAHALFFNGANKYPNYAYHDVATWKGNQYQDGAHVLPWFRAEARMENVTAVLGNIYGADFHNLPTPLYNEEQLMSADPEMGAQILIDTKHVHTDIFLNWQSYQFELDTHQEAFTVGVTGRVGIGEKQKVNILYSVLAQHRGGEQDITDLGVQTIANASIGGRYEEHHTGAIKSWYAEGNMFAAYQQAGKLWPFDLGYSAHVEGGMAFRNGLSYKVGYVMSPNDFISIYGNPLFSTVSIRKDKKRFDGMHTIYATAKYNREFGRGYNFGAFLETYQLLSHGLSEFDFAFGLYIRVNPWFVLGGK